MAGAISSAMDLVPKRRRSCAQALGAPGTMVGIQPSLGMAVWPASFTLSADRAMGATPEPSRP